MRRLFSLVLLFAILGVFGCAAAVEKIPSQKPVGLQPQRVIGAYADWRKTVVTPSRLPWSRLTHLVYAFALPNKDASINLEHATGLAAAVEAARENRVQVLLSIGGANGSAPFHTISTNPALRSRFVKEVLKLIVRYDLDGIDIDWEHWQGGKEDLKGRQGLVDLLEALYSQLRPAEKILTADVFAGDWYGKHYAAAIINYVDWLHVMAYDGSGSWSEKPEPHSSYEQAVEAINYWINKTGETNRHKLVLNVPFYGKKFLAGYKKGQSVGGMDYKEVLKRCHVCVKQDIYKTAAYTVFYNSQQTIQKKIQYANQRGLGGVGIWELTQDSLNMQNSLIGVFPKRR